MKRMQRFLSPCLGRILCAANLTHRAFLVTGILLLVSCVNHNARVNSKRVSTAFDTFQSESASAEDLAQASRLLDSYNAKPERAEFWLHIITCEKYSAEH